MCTYRTERDIHDKTQTLEKDNAQRHSNQIPRQQPFKEKLLPRVGLKPTTFSVLGCCTCTCKTLAWSDSDKMSIHVYVHVAGTEVMSDDGYCYQKMIVVSEINGNHPLLHPKHMAIYMYSLLCTYMYIVHIMYMYMIHSPESQI